jgi:hypothetical protein
MTPLNIATLLGVLIVVVAAPIAWRLLREIDELEHLSTRTLEPIDLTAWADDDPAA